MKLNVTAARKIINVLLKKYPSPTNIQKDNILALDNSLKILEARIQYLNGQFNQAIAIYNEVISKTKIKLLDYSCTKVKFILKCKLAERYFYAVCQIGRIKYQYLENNPLDRDEAKNLIKTAKKIEMWLKLIKNNEGKFNNIFEYEYYKHNFNTIKQIASWLAGRHTLRSFRDLIPTKQERTRHLNQNVLKAIELLRLPPKNEKSYPVTSLRWRAMRLRYLCRGYILKWILNLSTTNFIGKPDHDDLLNAYDAIQEALNEDKALGLERERMVNLFEAARLNILVMFGEVIRKAKTDTSRYSPALTFEASLYYLDKAFDKLKNTSEEKRKWLEILGKRLSCYFKLLSGINDNINIKGIKNKELKLFLKKNLKDMVEEVCNDYKNFAIRLGEESIMNCRIKYFKKTFKEVKKEINQYASSKKA